MCVLDHPFFGGFFKVVGVIKSLESDKFVSTEKLSSKKIELTEEARTIVENGSAEFLVFSGIPSAGIPKTDLAVSCGFIIFLLFEKEFSFHILPKFIFFVELATRCIYQLIFLILLLV